MRIIDYWDGLYCQKVCDFNMITSRWSHPERVYPDGQVPLDRPRCGLRGELCDGLRFTTSAAGLAIIIGLTSTASILIAAGLAWIWYGAHYSYSSQSQAYIHREDQF